MSHLISVEEAILRFREGQTVFLDVRFTFGEPTAGQEAYQRNHIPGAIHFDLNEDLSGPIMAHGGRHPLPDPDLFARKLGAAGIGPSTPVIVYDDQKGAVAARLWWMLRYYGHDDVRMLDTGFTQWCIAGGAVTAAPAAPNSNVFTPHICKEMTIDASEISRRLSDPGLLLIDSRVHGSYTAEQPTKYPVNGHIPGALNRYWEDGLSGEGVFLHSVEQKKRFADLPPHAEYAVYCNAGVTACPNVLALTEAGYKNVRLYVGSWGDWISYPANPIATGE
ncbi:sulfurtransferase [Paenibacillus pedocola]|uniref:sulfurtransferase n=1 Tax=Paenibacillus pedocola TaxID=3242193 RepID=UPI0028779EEA|nr:sulfurtransferase [Paenibacillus typhae]